MKAHKPDTDQTVELSVHINGAAVQEYALPPGLTRGGGDEDIVECFIPVSKDDHLHVKGHISGSVLSGQLHLLADGSFVSEQRMEGTEVKQRNRKLDFKSVLDCQIPAGWTSIETPKELQEGKLKVKVLDDDTVDNLSAYEIESSLEKKPGVGSLQVVVYLNQNPLERCLDVHRDITLGNWKRQETLSVRESGIQPDHELELEVENEEVTGKKSSNHRKHRTEMRSGLRAWARFIFYYRSPEAIQQAGCDERSDDVHELGDANLRDFVSATSSRKRNRQEEAEEEEKEEVSSRTNNSRASSMMSPPAPENDRTPTPKPKSRTPLGKHLGGTLNLPADCRNSPLLEEYRASRGTGETTEFAEVMRAANSLWDGDASQHPASQSDGASAGAPEYVRQAKTSSRDKRHADEHMDDDSMAPVEAGQHEEYSTDPAETSNEHPSRLLSAANGTVTGQSTNASNSHREASLARADPLSSSANVTSNTLQNLPLNHTILRTSQAQGSDTRNTNSSPANTSTGHLTSNTMHPHGRTFDDDYSKIPSAEQIKAEIAKAEDGVDEFAMVLIGINFGPYRREDLAQPIFDARRDEVAIRSPEDDKWYTKEYYAAKYGGGQRHDSPVPDNRTATPEEPEPDYSSFQPNFGEPQFESQEPPEPNATTGSRFSERHATASPRPELGNINSRPSERGTASPRPQLGNFAPSRSSQRPTASPRPTTSPRPTASPRPTLPEPITKIKEEEVEAETTFETPTPARKMAPETTFETPTPARKMAPPEEKLVTPGSSTKRPTSTRPPSSTPGTDSPATKKQKKSASKAKSKAAELKKEIEEKRARRLAMEEKIRVREEVKRKQAEDEEAELAELERQNAEEDAALAAMDKQWAEGDEDEDDDDGEEDE